MYFYVYCIIFLYNDTCFLHVRNLYQTIFLCVLLSVLDVFVPNDCLALFANIFSIWLAMLFMLSWFAFRLARMFLSSHSAIFLSNRCVFFSSHNLGVQVGVLFWHRLRLL